MNDIVWITLTNGRRDCIAQTIPIAEKQLDFGSNTVRQYIIDDSGDSDYRKWLYEMFPHFTVIPVDSEPAGYWRAMKKVFEVVRLSHTDYCFFLEDDFILTRKISINELVEVLTDNQQLAQVALIRQSWFANEQAYGGVIKALQASGRDFIPRHTLTGIDYLEHEAIFTGNPNLFPAQIANREWPDGSWSESRFSRNLFKHNKINDIRLPIEDRQPASMYCAYMGTENEEWCEHIGHDRLGGDY